MPSALDRTYDAVLAKVLGEGGPIQIGRDAEGRAIVANLPPTLPMLFDAFCMLHGAVDAVIAGDERLTFADLNARATKLARVLAGSWNVAKGDRVAIAMRNCPAWIVAYMAVLKAGGIATLINGWWQADEMRHALGLAEPELIIADEPRAKRLAAGGCTIPTVALPVEKPIDGALAPLHERSGEADLPAVAPEDDATILFTSGSTGLAKGAVSTHRAVTTGVYAYTIGLATLRGIKESQGETVPDPKTLVNVPLFHVTGEVPVLLNSFVIGRTMVLMPKWDPGEALRLIEREKITYFVGVPTMSLELMQHPDRDRLRPLLADRHRRRRRAAPGRPRQAARGQLPRRPAGARLRPDRDQRGRLRQFLVQLSRQARLDRPPACADRRARHIGRRRPPSARRRARRDRDPLGRQHPRLLARRGGDRAPPSPPTAI